VHQLETQQAERLEGLATKSLGTLVKGMFESYVRVEGTESVVLDEDKARPDQISIGFRVTMQMTQERLEQTKASLLDLVALRNELVHHLIDKFDLWSPQGCVAASSHLTEYYSRIDKHFEELRSWAQTMDNARAMHASLVQSQVFTDLVVNGIMPGGSVDWPSSGIVRVLREAAKELSQDGWTRLDDAIAWIVDRHPEQTPTKYGCRTWPHVLNEAAQFNFRYRLEEDGRKSGWYREKA